MIQIDTIEFLTELYGWSTGWLTLWTKRDKRTAWLDVTNHELIADTAQSMGQDVYFGVGISSERKITGRLTADDVDCIPGFWMDIDIAGNEHKENNLPASLNQAVEFMNSLPFAPTIIVDSGHGLHSYWLFREPWTFDTPEERNQAKSLLKGWQEFIRSRAALNKWNLDSTHDLARVLRLPGTTNYKSDSVPVAVVSHNNNRYNPSDFDQYAAAITTKEKRDKFKRNPSDGPASEVINNCIFMQVCREHAAELSEPQWTAMITNIARCSDGPAVVHELSRPYQGYSEQETQDKIFHALNGMSPQSCQYIQETLGFNQCPSGGCGVKSPCGWALSIAKRTANMEVIADGEKPVPDGFFDTDVSVGATISKFTDLGNAEYFAKYYDGKVKHCSQMDKWLVWDGKKWTADNSNQILVLAGKCVRSMYDYLSRMNDDDQRKKLFNHAMKSEDARRLKSMITLAKGFMPISVDELDSDPWLLNSPSGIIDLKTGELLPHSPKKYMTKIISATYDTNGKCPVFDKFLSSVFDGNKNIIGFMRRLLGYCLTGDTREQQFVIAWGALGRNGKGTLLNLILDILADYAKTTPTDVLYSKKYEKQSNDIARLAGARYVLASEGEKGKKFDEPLIKKMTGQDMLAARFLYKETFEFMPQFKLILMTNDKPVASEDDAALWSRIQLVPFTKRFDGAEQDKSLKTRLREPNELAGILQWLIRGCLEWQQTGLNPPEEVLHATREYQRENDKLKDWISECCVVGDKMISSPKELYHNFQSWSLENGEKFIMIYKNFTAALIKRGFEKFVGTGNYTKMRGIALLARYEEKKCAREDPY